MSAIIVDFKDALIGAAPAAAPMAVRAVALLLLVHGGSVVILTAVAILAAVAVAVLKVVTVLVVSVLTAVAVLSSVTALAVST